MRECYTALDTMSLVSRRRRDGSIVQAPPEVALVERTAEDMPSGIVVRSIADQRFSRESAAELEPQAGHSRASGNPVLPTGAVLA